MNKRKKAALIKALNSGEYKQAEGTLRDGNSFCCLGVACDINIDMHWELIDDGEGRRYGLPGTNQHDLERGEFDGISLPTPEALKEIGLTSHEAYELAGMNDEGKTFLEIAKHIKEKM